MLNRKLKILFIHASAELGGTEISTFQLVSRLNRTKYEVQTLFHCPPGAILNFYRDTSIPYLQCQFPRLWPAIQYVRRFDPDITQIYGLRTNIIWRPLLYFMGYRKIFGVVQGLSNRGEEPSWIRLALDRLTDRWQSKYIVISKTLARKLIDAGFQENRLQVIYNGITIPNEIRKQPAHPIPRIVCVANLRSVKGHRYLLNALKIIHDNGVPFEADIVGDGSDRKYLERLSGTYGIDSNVHFHGRVASVEPYLLNADIFTLLSLSEGLPGAIMEAMALSIPIVATSVGGNPELITDGLEGYLVPPREPRIAAERLMILLKDSALRQQMGIAGHHKVKFTFDFQQTVNAYEGLYDHCSIRHGTD